MILQEFKDAFIIHLLKQKGNRQVCDSHRGISLLSIAGKKLARTLLNRLTAHLEQGLLPESQCSFRKHRSTTRCFLRGSFKRNAKNKMMTYSPYVDLTKAFNTASRDGLWRIMAKYGCPGKFITMVRLFHDGMQASMKDIGMSSEPGQERLCLGASTIQYHVFSYAV